MLPEDNLFLSIVKLAILPATEVKYPSSLTLNEGLPSGPRAISPCLIRIPESLSVVPPAFSP